MLRANRLSQGFMSEFIYLARCPCWYLSLGYELMGAEGRVSIILSCL